MQKEVESWEPCDPKEGKDCESSTFFTTCNFQIILVLNSFIRWSQLEKFCEKRTWSRCHHFKTNIIRTTITEGAFHIQQTYIKAAKFRITKLQNNN